MIVYENDQNSNYTLWQFGEFWMLTLTTPKRIYLCVSSGGMSSRINQGFNNVLAAVDYIGDEMSGYPQDPDDEDEADYLEIGKTFRKVEVNESHRQNLSIYLGFISALLMGRKNPEDRIILIKDIRNPPGERQMFDSLNDEALFA